MILVGFADCTNTQGRGGKIYYRKETNILSQDTSPIYSQRSKNLCMTVLTGAYADNSFVGYVPTL